MSVIAVARIGESRTCARARPGPSNVFALQRGAVRIRDRVCAHCVQSAQLEFEQMDILAILVLIAAMIVGRFALDL